MTHFLVTGMNIEESDDQLNFDEHMVDAAIVDEESYTKVLTLNRECFSVHWTVLNTKEFFGIPDSQLNFDPSNQIINVDDKKVVFLSNENFYTLDSMEPVTKLGPKKVV